MRLPGIRIVVVALGLLAVATLAVVLGRSRLFPPSRPSSANPAAAMDPRAALLAGGRLGGAGEHVESVPYFRRAVEGAESWEGRFNLASALANASLQVRLRAGHEEPAMRSSVERVKTVFESFREGDRALGLAPDARSRALTVLTRAQHHWTWGFPIDALELARSARDIDPTWDAPAGFVLRVERDLARGGAPQ